MPTFAYFLIFFCTNILSWQRVYSSYSSDCLPGREPCWRTWWRFKCLRIQEAYRFLERSKNTSLSSESTSMTQTSGWISQINRVKNRNIASPRFSPSSLKSVRKIISNQTMTIRMMTWTTDGIHKRREHLMTLLIQKCLLTSLRVSISQPKLEEQESALVRWPTQALISLIVRLIKEISSYLTRRINHRTRRIKDYWVALE